MLKYLSNVDRDVGPTHRAGLSSKSNSGLSDMKYTIEHFTTTK